MIGIAGRCRGRVERWFAALGVLSLPIYVLHIFLLPILPRILQRLPLRSDSVALLVGTILGTAGSIALYRLACRIQIDNWLALSGRSPFGRRPVARAAPG